MRCQHRSSPTGRTSSDAITKEVGGDVRSLEPQESRDRIAARSKGKTQTLLRSCASPGSGAALARTQTPGRGHSRSAAVRGDRRMRTARHHNAPVPDHPACGADRRGGGRRLQRRQGALVGRAVTGGGGTSGGAPRSSLPLTYTPTRATSIIYNNMVTKEVAPEWQSVRRRRPGASGLSKQSAGRLAPPAHCTRAAHTHTHTHIQRYTHTVSHQSPVSRRALRAAVSQK